MYKNHFGIQTVIIRNIYQDIKYGFNSVEELEKMIDECIGELMDTKPIALKALAERLECDHSFKDPTYTVQRRVIGYVTVYQRVCSDCGCIENVTKETDGTPDWADGAKEQYYNNSI